MQVTWEGSLTESEVDKKEYPLENDRIVSYYHCPHCGSDYEFREGKNDKKR